MGGNNESDSEEAALLARPSRRMAAGTISPVAVLRDARNRNRLLPISILLYVPKSGRPDFGCALLRTRLMDDVDMIRTSETLYWAGKTRARPGLRRQSFFAEAYYLRAYPTRKRDRPSIGVAL